MNIKYNSKQRYKSIQGLRSFKDTLPKEARRILNKKKEKFIIILSTIGNILLEVNCLKFVIQNLLEDQIKLKEVV